MTGQWCELPIIETFFNCPHEETRNAFHGPSDKQHFGAPVLTGGFFHSTGIPDGSESMLIDTENAQGNWL